MFGGDEVGALVIDTGSSYTKIGYAGEDHAKGIFRTAVGVRYGDESQIGGAGAVGDTEAMDVSSSSSSSSSSADSKLRHYFVGHEQEIRRDNMEITYPVRHGLVQDWDGVEQLWDFCFKKHLQVDPKMHPIMVSEAPFVPHADRAAHLELLFEKFQVPATYLAKDAVLAAFASGRSTALIVDIGGGKTVVTPVHDGYVLHAGVRKTKLGGDVLDEVLEDLLFTSQSKTCPARFQYQRERVQNQSVSISGRSVDSIVAKKLDFPLTSSSFARYQVKQVLQDIKETLCMVSDTKFDPKASLIPSISYELPDGQIISVAGERFICTETLFAPYDVQNDFDPQAQFPGLQRMVIEAVDAVDVDVKKEIFGNVILTGGVTLLPGLPKRLINFVAAHVPPALKVKSPSQGSERRFGVWVGGSILGSLGTFHQMWFSKGEYQEYGAEQLTKRCP